MQHEEHAAALLGPQPVLQCLQPTQQVAMQLRRLALAGETEAFGRIAARKRSRSTGRDTCRLEHVNDVTTALAATECSSTAGTVRPTGATGVAPQQGATMRLRHVRPRHRAALALGASLLAFGLLAAACGSDDSGSSAGTTAAGGARHNGRRWSRHDRWSGYDRRGGDADAGRQARRSASRPTPAARGSRRRRCSRSRATPSRGRCSIRSHSSTADGKVEPYLAESITPNADYTVWTIKARPGITFHDGTPFDGAALVDNLTRPDESFLTGSASDVATNADSSPRSTRPIRWPSTSR